MSLFEFAGPRSSKVRCTVCGRTGWGPLEPEPSDAFPWQAKCLAGHPFACLCGVRYASAQALSTHLRGQSPRSRKHRKVEDTELPAAEGTVGAWAEHIREVVAPQIASSYYVMTMLPEGSIDVKFAVELGLSIMLNKPIIVVKAKDAEVPEKLAWVSDYIIDWDGTPESLSPLLKEATTTLEQSGVLHA